MPPSRRDQSRAYQQIAQRSLLASRACLTNFLQEKAAFLAYHSFESTGRALVLHTLNGVQVGSCVRHETKIQRFIQAATVYGIDATVSALESDIGSLQKLNIVGLILWMPQ